MLATISSSDRIAVFYTNGMDEERQVFSSSSPNDIATLRDAIQVDLPKGWFRCACIPSTMIYFYQGKKTLGSLAVYSGDDLNFSSWSGDAKISNTEPWFAWFDRHGIKRPRKEYEAENALEEASQRAVERWVKAMPNSLRPLWPDGLQPDVLMRFDLTPLDAALNRQFPNKNARILSLLAWYGSGGGPWSGFPVYETVPEQMLFEYSTPELVDAVISATLSEQETEGAARLFGGWEFRSKRPAEITLLPAELKRTLLAHALKSTDKDKVERARSAFSEDPAGKNP